MAATTASTRSSRMRDEAYAKNRKALKLANDRLIKISDGIGLHPAMGEAGKLVESGRLGIVPGVGYPNPNRSHFAAWRSGTPARLDLEEHGGPGWLGREPRLGDRGRRRLFVGAGSIPAAIRGRRALAVEPGADRRSDARPGRVAADPSLRSGGDLAGSCAGARSMPTPRVTAWPSWPKTALRRPAIPGTGLAEPAQAGRPPDQGGLRLARFLHVAGWLRHSLAAVGHCISGCSTSFPGRSRRFSTTWRARSWPIAFWSSASANSAGVCMRTARRHRSRLRRPGLPRGPGRQARPARCLPQPDRPRRRRPQAAPRFPPGLRDDPRRVARFAVCAGARRAV